MTLIIFLLLRREIRDSTLYPYVRGTTFDLYGSNDAYDEEVPPIVNYGTTYESNHRIRFLVFICSFHLPLNLFNGYT